MKKCYLALEKHESLGFDLHLLSARDGEGLPTVIYLHGFTGSKENHLEVRLGIAGLGCLLVSFDAWGHGDRRPLPELWNACRDNLPQTFEEVLLNTVDDTLCVCRHLQGRKEVDPGRIAVVGGSMGAMVGLMSVPRLEGRRCLWRGRSTW